MRPSPTPVHGHRGQLREPSTECPGSYFRDATIAKRPIRGVANPSAWARGFGPLDEGSGHHCLGENVSLKNAFVFIRRLKVVEEC
jgi:hypothetical protein